MTTGNQNVGRQGEEIACSYLQHRGYSIVCRNYHSHWGELDIVAKKDKRIVFVEVKTRATETKGQPFEEVTFFKRKHLMRTVQNYLIQHPHNGYTLSVDLVTVRLHEGGKPDIRYYENIAFDSDRKGVHL